VFAITAEREFEPEPEPRLHVRKHTTSVR
jgi:hypothetical protein